MDDQGHFLLPRQERDVALAVAASGIAPTEFTWGQQPNGAVNYGSGWDIPKVPVLRHESVAFFAFEWANQRGGQHWAYYMPDADRPRRRVSAGSWDQELLYVKQWLKNLREELATPPAWEQLIAEGTFTWPTTPPSNNEPFTPEEQAQIAARLAAIEAAVLADPETDEDAKNELRNSIQELTEAAKRLGRWDWKRVVLGEVISWGIRQFVAGPMLHEVLHLLDVGLAQILGGSPTLGGLPPPPV